MRGNLRYEDTVPDRVEFYFGTREPGVPVWAKRRHYSREKSRHPKAAGPTAHAALFASAQNEEGPSESGRLRYVLPGKSQPAAIGDRQRLRDGGGQQNSPGNVHADGVPWRRGR